MSPASAIFASSSSFTIHLSCSINGASQPMAVEAICVTLNRSPAIVYGPLIELQPPFALTPSLVNVSWMREPGTRATPCTSVDR